MWSIFRSKDAVMNFDKHYELTNPNFSSGTVEFTEKWNSTNKVTASIGIANPRPGGYWDSAAYYEGNIKINYIQAPNE